MSPKIFQGDFQGNTQMFQKAITHLALSTEQVLSQTSKGVVVKIEFAFTMGHNGSLYDDVITER